MKYFIEFINFFLFSFLALFPLINPIGMSPFFLQMTKSYSKEEKRYLAKKVAKNTAVLLIIVLFTGSFILRVFGVSLNFIQIAGGLLVAWSAWRSLNHTKTSYEHEQNNEKSKDVDSIAFFPLTMPLTAGAGAIAVTIALDTRVIDKFSFLGLFQYLGILLGIAMVSLLVRLCYYYAEDIFKRIGRVGAEAVTSISAMIILAIGVEVFWEGLSPLIKTLLKG